MNYWASVIARDAMPEPVVINLDSDDDDSLTGKASKHENDRDLSRYEMKL